MARPSGQLKKAFSSLPKVWRLVDQPLSAQFFVVAGMVAFSILLVSVLLSFQVHQQTRASRELTKTHSTLTRLGFLSRDFYRQQTAVLEFVRTHNVSFAEDVHRQRKHWDEHIVVLEKSDVPAELKKLKTSYESWTKVADLLMIEPTPNVNGLSEEFHLSQDVLIDLEKFVESQNELLAKREVEEQKSVTSTYASIVVLNVLLLLSVGLALFRLHGSIAKPVSRLSETIHRYESGEFESRSDVTSRSAIGFLQASFNEMAEKIETLVNDLRGLDEMKTDFISTVTHELRTPLTSIGGYSKLLLTGDAGEINPTQKEFLEIIETNCARLTNLVDDILDVEKMESGRVQLTREPQQLDEILKEVKKNFQVVAVQKGLEFRFDVPSDFKPVLGERKKLIQIFGNLVSNAIKYTEHGFVGISAKQTEYALVIRVSDSGIGISAEEQKELFQKFYRTRSGLSSSESGTGLGLAIARGLVEAHGGTIQLESAQGKGTVFTVALPTGKSQGPQILREKKAPAQIVWLIDTDSATRDKIRSVLESGSPYLSAAIEVRLISMIEEIPDIGYFSQKPELILIDPKEKLEQIVELRKRVGQGVPIIVMSSVLHAPEIFENGGSSFLSKPFDDRDLLLAIKALL